MSTAVRSIAPTAEPDALVPAAHVYDLIAANARLERDLVSARARNNTLMRELRRALQAPKLLGQSTVDGCLTLTYDTGRVTQLQPFSDCGDGYTEYGHRWVELTPAPDTATAIVTETLTQVDDEDERAFDATPFLGGMEVLA